MLEEFKVYIVNLRKDTERKKNIVNELAKQNIKNYKFIEAVDGNNLSKEDLKNCLYINKKKINIWNEKLTLSQIGCALSHIKIYQDFIKSNKKYALVFEDDAIFLENFTLNLQRLIIKNFKFEKQIFLLSELKEFIRKPIDKMGKYEAVKVTNAFFTHAYLINKEAAKSILKFNYPVKTVADNFVYFKIYCGVNLIGLNPFLIDQDKKNFNTTIDLWQENQKKFLLRRFLYKFKNKILKRFIKFSGH